MYGSGGTGTWALPEWLELLVLLSAGMGQKEGKTPISKEGPSFGQ